MYSMAHSNECTKISEKIGFIGAGNMAQALGKGIISAGIVDPSQIIVSAPSDINLKVWRDWGAKTTNDNGKVIDFAYVVFLAVKPHLLDNALMHIQLAKEIPAKVFVSILAGMSIETLVNKLKESLKLHWSEYHVVVRAMVNTPLMVGAGCSVFCPDRPFPDVSVVERILSSAGTCQEVPEYLINAAGGIFGCGPAFMYLILEALADGGVKQGVPRNLALSLACQTMSGAARMVLETGRHPARLREEVCSPGGTTIAGVHALERAAVRSAMMDAIEATVKRAEEMAKTMSSST